MNGEIGNSRLIKLADKSACKKNGKDKRGIERDA